MMKEFLKKDYIMFILVLFILISFSMYVFVTIFWYIGITELYFYDYSDLPNEIKMGEKYYFRFDIYNLENKKIDYNYQIIIEESNMLPKILKDEKITLGHKQKKMIRGEFRMNSSFDYSKVQVRLRYLNKTQEIHFFVNME